MPVAISPRVYIFSFMRISLRMHNANDLCTCVHARVRACALHTLAQLEPINRNRCGPRDISIIRRIAPGSRSIGARSRASPRVRRVTNGCCTHASARRSWLSMPARRSSCTCIYHAGQSYPPPHAYSGAVAQLILYSSGGGSRPNWRVRASCTERARYF